LREPTLTLPEMRAREPLAAHELPLLDLDAASAAAAESHAGVAPEAQAPSDELTSVRARQERPGEPAADERQDAPADPGADEYADVPKVQAAPAAPPSGVSAPIVREVLPELPGPAPPLVEWPPDKQRRIVALRLVAPLPQRFAGRSLRQALAAEGFVLGRFAIFHKPDEARRAILSAASLNRPGTFDADTMDSQHYGGLSLFAVLPGPKAPPQAFDELVFTARSLNERLQGVLQDEQGGPLTPSRIAYLREHLNAGAAL
jgi:cell division protein ZipA